MVSEGSLAGWAYGAELFAKGALLLARVAGACIRGGGVAAELAISWSRTSRFANLCSILWRSCDCCTSNAARLVSAVHSVEVDLVRR